MTGIIFDIKALQPYSEGISVCRGYMQDKEYGLALQGATSLMKCLREDNCFDRRAKRVIRGRIKDLESEIHETSIKENLTLVGKNSPNPPYDGAS